MCKNLKKAFKIKFYTFPAHFSAPVKVTYDFYSCFPQFSATHACCPQLSAPPRSISAHQRGLERWNVAESCGKGIVLRRTAEKSLVLREIIGPVLLKMSWCAEKESMRNGEKEVDNEGEGRREGSSLFHGSTAYSLFLAELPRNRLDPPQIKSVSWEYSCDEEYFK